jgi:hypothetical protein
MKTLWVSFAILFALSLSGCTPSQVLIGLSQPLPADGNLPQASPSQTLISGSSTSNPSLPQIPVPTVGSVVITNTTATPISSSSSTSALTPDLILQGLAQQARQDLANHLNVPIDKIEFLKVVPAKWPYDNGGCPLSDEERIDTSITGYQILLSASDQVYIYHTDGKDWLGLCTIKPPNEIRTLP